METLNHSHVDLEADGAASSNEHEQPSGMEENKGLTDSVSQDLVVVVDKIRVSSVSECSIELDLEAGVQENKVHLVKNEKDCRICHLSMDVTNQESGIPIELGCSCKNDLAAAHKHCAEAWFKIKGDIICEICGSIARNVAVGNELAVVEQWNEEPSVTVAPAAPPASRPESRSIWLGHRFLNFLLACMVFAFVISWLFHFNVPS